jgi:phosphoenolpyruvate carboxylase
MQTQVNDYKRVIEKYKLGANNPKHLANKTNNVIKNVQSIHTDINSIINESFSGNNIQEILQNIIKHLTAPNSYFDFQKITLQTFDSHKIQVLQRAIYKVVTNIIETESTSVVSAITNTILRNKFQYIHTQFAKHILDASNISRGVFKFFGDICVEQTEGQRWHSFAITRFMKEYSEQQTFIKELKDEIIKLRNRLKKMQPVLEKLELEFSEEYYELAKKSKQLERLIHKQVVYLSEEKLKFADLKGKYDELLFAVTKTLLEKRRVIKVD